MSLSLWFHPDAETELNEAADYYALQGPGLDRRFIAEIERALDEQGRAGEARRHVRLQRADLTD